MADFDRVAWITDYLTTLKVYEINDISGLRVDNDERRPAIIESVRSAVLEAYQRGDVDPRHPQNAVHEIAEGMVSPYTGDRVAEFSVIEAVLNLTFGEEGLTPTPGTRVPDFLGDALQMVYDQGVGLLLTNIEEAAQEAEQEWDAAQSDDDELEDDSEA